MNIWNSSAKALYLSMHWPCVQTWDFACGSCSGYSKTSSVAMQNVTSETQFISRLINHLQNMTCHEEYIVDSKICPPLPPPPQASLPTCAKYPTPTKPPYPMCAKQGSYNNSVQVMHFQILKDHFPGQVTSPWYNCNGWLGVKHQVTYWTRYC